MAHKKYSAPTIRPVPGVMQQAFGQTCALGDANTGGLCSRGTTADSGGTCDMGTNADQGTCSVGVIASDGTCETGGIAVGGTCGQGGGGS